MELSSAKPLTYKLAVGPWVNGAAGSTLAATPLDLRTSDVPCRVKLEKIGYLQVLPGTELHLDVSGADVAVTLNKGGLVYGLYERVTLKATTTDGSYSVQAGSETPGAAAKAGMFASMGVIQLTPSSAKPSIEISNVKGQASLHARGNEAVEVVAGQKYSTQSGAVGLAQANAKDEARPVDPSALVSKAPVAAAEGPAATAVAFTTSSIDRSVTPEVMQGILTIVFPGATDDDLSKIATPHLAASPWSPPPRNRGPLVTR